MAKNISNFDITSYPKSHGSLEGWRLADFLHLDHDAQHQVYKELERFCLHRAENAQAIQQLNDYQYLGSGWEWSVFAQDQHTVIKVPAGVFPEVEDPEYLDNARQAYDLMRRYYPIDLLAKTEFNRVNHVNTIKQEWLSGKDWTLIDFDHAEPWLLQRLELLFEATADLINEQKWLPDLWLDHDPRGFILRNTMIDPSVEQFAIIDFTSYLDPARMYPALCEQHCQTNSERVAHLLETTRRALTRS